MKAFCTNCGEIKPASFRKGICTAHAAEYEDLCCDDCHSILATVEEREGPAVGSQTGRYDVVADGSPEYPHEE